MTEIGDLSETPKEVVFEWEIRDFLALPYAANKRYESAKFYFSGASWILQIFPNGSTTEELRWISLYIARRSSGFPITLNYSFSIKDIDGNKKEERGFTNSFEEEYIRIGIPRFIERATLMENKYKLLPGNNLTIVCTLKSSEPNAVSNSLFHRHQDVCNGLHNIYINAKNSDLELKFSGNGILRAHRVILESRSPTFAAMFNNETKEKGAGEISIKDVDKDTMHHLLDYLYCGEMITPTKENVFSLYIAAEKYGIEYVKVVSHDFIIRNLSVDWVTDIITFSKSHKLGVMYRRAIEYFKENADEIIESEKWKHFVKVNHDIGVELLNSLVKSLLPSKKKPQKDENLWDVN